MNKLLVICGPTGVGKTALAARMAKKFKGELVSADSRQVYKGMDIGTGKDRPRGIRIHLLDVVKPDEEFSVSQYYQMAWKAIKNIWSRRKLPILVGGTGFYIKAVTQGVETKDIPPDNKLRQKISDWPVKKLFNYLENLDPFKAASLNKSDRNNPRRLVRAIEVACFKKENPLFKTKKPPLTSILFVGLGADYKYLYRRIDRRVRKRTKMGAAKEVRNLISSGFNWDLPALNSMGYIQWKPFFEKKASEEEVIKNWQFAEHAYARRQITWFKKALCSAASGVQGQWFDVSQSCCQADIEKIVKNWYYQVNA